MRNRARKIFLLCVWLCLWQAVAEGIGNKILLVGPLQVISALWKNMVTTAFWKIILFSFARIGAGFLTAFLLGITFGVWSYRRTVIREFLSPFVQTLKSIPVASFVVLLLIWFGSSAISYFISLLIVFPNVYVNTLAGLQSTDKKLLEMAKVFQMPKRYLCRYIYVPALLPYLKSCLEVTLGLSLKSGVAAEVIGMTSGSLGERLYMAKIQLDTADLFAWTLVVILLSYLFEKTILKLYSWYADRRPIPKRVMDGKYKKSARKSEVSRESENTVGIQLNKINKSYKGQVVLKNVTFTLDKGGKYLLQAPSGAGKTTLLGIVAGIVEPDTGSVNGVRDGRLAMVFQESRLCEEYDAITNIMLTMRGTPFWLAENVVDSITDRVSLIEEEAAILLPKGSLHKPVKELSGGMKRRVEILRAVLSGADILLLDEPFASLDEENCDKVVQYLLERQLGRTLLLSSHREEDETWLETIPLLQTGFKGRSKEL